MSYPPLTLTQSLAFKAADALVGAHPWPTQPPPQALADVADQASDLDAALSEVLQLPDGSPDPTFKDLGVVLIDFGQSGASPKPRPRFATRQETSKRVPIGSLGKIGILYAAFQLRTDVQTALTNLVRSGATAPTTNDILGELGRYWQGIPALKSLNLRLPLLDQMFAQPTEQEDGSWTVEFSGMDQVGYSTTKDWCSPDNLAKSPSNLVQQLQNVHDLEHVYGHASKTSPDKPRLKGQWQHSLLERTFAERLWLTTRWSDNLAATLCMADVSANRLGYVKAVLAESGLGSGNNNLRDTGFWLRGAYESAVPPAIEASARLWEATHWQYSDAASLARLMLALQARTLISPEASENMLGLLRELNPKRVDDRNVQDRNGAPALPGVGSPIEHGLPQYPELAWTKVGISGNVLADWALFDYSFAKWFGGGRRILGLVVVNGRGTVSDSDIGNFTTELITILDS